MGVKILIYASRYTRRVDRKTQHGPGLEASLKSMG